MRKFHEAAWSKIQRRTSTRADLCDTPGVSIGASCECRIRAAKTRGTQGPLNRRGYLGVIEIMEKKMGTAIIYYNGENLVSRRLWNLKQSGGPLA